MDLKEFFQQTKKKADQLWKQRADINNYQITGAWLRGFIEADGSFINDSTNNRPCFEISQHSSDSVLLQSIQTFFGCGSIRFEKRISKRTGDPMDMCVYRMSSKKEIEEKLLPLLTKGFLFKGKKDSYEQWLKKHFPHFQASTLDMANSFDIDWLVGFSDGDGSFFFRIDETPPRWIKEKPINQSKTGYQVRCVFDLAQKENQDSFDQLGKILFPENKEKIFEIYTNQDKVSHLRITSFKLLDLYVKPLFYHQFFQSRKSLDWFLWNKGLYLMKNKQHLSEGGLP